MTVDDLAVAQRLADIADGITRAAYRAGRSLPHEIKGDGSPVTDHDREVEEALRDELRRLRPDDGFVGEEVGAHGHGERRWVVDGIDGTGNFVVGDLRWSTQIALMWREVPVVGVSTSPAQQRRWWAATTTPARTAPLSAAGLGTPTTTMRVSRVGRLDRARVTCIPPRDRLGVDQYATFTRVLGAARYVEPTTHGAKMVAAGDVDACLQLRGELWDYAALAVLVDRAGGAVHALDGVRHLDHGGPLLFSNGHLPIR
jgi:histidinol-phosphatase